MAGEASYRSQWSVQQKPLADAQNEAAHFACFGALIWRGLLLLVSSVGTAICRYGWYWSHISHTSHSLIALLLESPEPLARTAIARGL